MQGIIIAIITRCDYWFIVTLLYYCSYWLLWLYIVIQCYNSYGIIDGYCVITIIRLWLLVYCYIIIFVIDWYYWILWFNFIIDVVYYIHLVILLGILITSHGLLFAIIHTTFYYFVLLHVTIWYPCAYYLIVSLIYY